MQCEGTCCVVFHAAIANPQFMDLQFMVYRVDALFMDLQFMVYRVDALFMDLQSLEAVNALFMDLQFMVYRVEYRVYRVEAGNNPFMDLQFLVFNFEKHHPRVGFASPGDGVMQVDKTSEGAAAMAIPPYHRGVLGGYCRRGHPWPGDPEGPPGLRARCRFQAGVSRSMLPQTDPE